MNSYYIDEEKWLSSKFDSYFFVSKILKYSILLIRENIKITKCGFTNGKKWNIMKA